MKSVTTGEGGMVTTNDAALAETMARLRNHGASVSEEQRHLGPRPYVLPDFNLLGFNYRMTDIQGAIGREQLQRLSSLVTRRRQLAARYHAALGAASAVHVPVEPEWARSNWQSYAVRVPPGRQRAVMQALLDDGISTRRGVMNAHREPAYGAGTWKLAPGQRLDRSEEAHDTAIMLPLFHDLAEADQDRVIDALLRAVSTH